jgi:hypothetical protein
VIVYLPPGPLSVPLAVPTTFTDTLESGAPVELVTVPVICPVACAASNTGHASALTVAAADNHLANLEILIGKPPTGTMGPRPLLEMRAGAGGRGTPGRFRPGGEHSRECDSLSKNGQRPTQRDFDHAGFEQGAERPSACWRSTVRSTRPEDRVSLA